MRKLYAVAALLPVGFGLLIAVLVLRHAEARSAPAYRGSEPPGRIVAPDFALRDSSGRLVRMSALRGKVVLVTFLDTRCTESCPIIAGHIRAGLARLAPEQRRRVVALAISVSPVDDTRSSARAFLRRHRIEGELRYLIGSERELRPVWKGFQIASALDTGDSDVHSAPVRIFDRHGVWVSTLHAGADLTPANLAHDLSTALADA